MVEKESARERLQGCAIYVVRNLGSAPTEAREEILKSEALKGLRESAILNFLYSDFLTTIPFCELSTTCNKVIEGEIKGNWIALR